MFVTRLMAALVLSVATYAGASDASKPAANAGAGVSGSKVRTLHEDSPPLVSLVALIANPAVFDKKEIHAVGYLNLGFEDNVLYLSAADAQNQVSSNAIWLRGLRSCRTESSGRYVVLRGVFVADRGAKNLFGGTLERVSRCENWPLQQ